jgi:putative transposase
LHTPADVHHPRTAYVQQARRPELEQARQTHHKRFAFATGLAEILDVLAAAWIKRPNHDQAEQNSAA